MCFQMKVSEQFDRFLPERLTPDSCVDTVGLLVQGSSTNNSLTGAMMKRAREAEIHRIIPWECGEEIVETQEVMAVVVQEDDEDEEEVSGGSSASGLSMPARDESPSRRYVLCICTCLSHGQNAVSIPILTLSQLMTSEFWASTSPRPFCVHLTASLLRPRHHVPSAPGFYSRSVPQL